MKRIALIVLLNCSFAQAMNTESLNLFVRALKSGSASAPLPHDGQFGPAIKTIQKLAGDQGPIMIEAWRISRFKQQALCGRVGFTIVQPSSKRSWPELGGQLNICESGTPPWRMCKDKPNVLVPPDQRCPDKSNSVDTPEIAKAIETALASGSLSEDQVRKRFSEAAANQKKQLPPDLSKP